MNLHKGFSWDHPGDKVSFEQVWENFGKHVQPKANYRIAPFHLQLTTEGRITHWWLYFLLLASCHKMLVPRCQGMEYCLIEQIIIGTSHANVQKSHWQEDQNWHRAGFSTSWGHMNPPLPKWSNSAWERASSTVSLNKSSKMFVVCAMAFVLCAMRMWPQQEAIMPSTRHHMQCLQKKTLGKCMPVEQERGYSSSQCKQQEA